MLSDFWIWAIVVIAIRLVAMSIGSIWVWAERRAAAPIMKERINSGSDRFFQEEHEREKEIVTGEGPPLDNEAFRKLIDKR